MRKRKRPKQSQKTQELVEQIFQHALSKWIGREQTKKLERFPLRSPVLLVEFQIGLLYPDKITNPRLARSIKIVQHEIRKHAISRQEAKKVQRLVLRKFRELTNKILDLFEQVSSYSPLW